MSKALDAIFAANPSLRERNAHLLNALCSNRPQKLWQEQGFKSSWEMQYAEHLTQLQRAGEVAYFRYEHVRLKVTGGNTATERKSSWYVPDFLVVYPDGRTEIHEVKGFMRERALLKLKVVAEAYPWWPIVIVKRDKGTWIWKRF